MRPREWTKTTYRVFLGTCLAVFLVVLGVLLWSLLGPGPRRSAATDIVLTVIGLVCIALFGIAVTLRHDNRAPKGKDALTGNRRDANGLSAADIEWERSMRARAAATSGQGLSGGGMPGGYPPGTAAAGADMTIRLKPLPLVATGEGAEPTTERDRQFEALLNQLGNRESPAARLAAVYAIEEIADSWERDHRPDKRHTCAESLCAYLRRRLLPGDEEVRRTIAKVIRRHALRGDGDKTHFSWADQDFDFSDADLYGVTFDQAEFRGRVTFRRARFHGLASFVGAQFAGQATVSFEKATFDDAEFVWTSFAGPVDFDGALFAFSASFLRAYFAGGVPAAVRPYWSPRDSDTSADAVAWRQAKENPTPPARPAPRQNPVATPAAPSETGNVAPLTGAGYSPWAQQEGPDDSWSRITPSVFLAANQVTEDRTGA